MWKLYDENRKLGGKVWKDIEAAYDVSPNKEIRRMPGKHRKHTPIVSEAQRGKFGVELGRRRAGKKRRMAAITTPEFESHLREAGGKDLPARSRKRG